MHPGAKQGYQTYRPPRVSFEKFPKKIKGVRIFFSFPFLASSKLENHILLRWLFTELFGASFFYASIDFNDVFVMRGHIRINFYLRVLFASLLFNSTGSHGLL